jgi:DMSO/TMAO reductase YedYZ molybdopterin-dependent catalytic subunit
MDAKRSHGDGPRERETVVWGRGFWAGVAGGAVVAIVLFAYRFATGMPTLQEALAERMILLLPYQVFALILARLQHLAKPLGLAMAVVTSVIGFGLGGVLYAWAARRSRRPRLILGLLAAAITWVFLMFIFLPLIQGGLLGMPLTTVVSAPALPMAVASLAYGLLLAGLASPRAGAPASPVPAVQGSSTPASAETVSRRDLLQRSALMVVAAAAGTRLAAWIGAAGVRIAAAAAAAFRLVKGMPPEITPNGQFYQVSKNFFDPTVDVAHWTLEVTGLVTKPLRLSYSAFTKAAPPVERYQTLECISNEVGGDLISTAKWKGVRARDILALAGVRPGATTIIWRSADGYAESIPIAVAQDPATLLAYEMNAEPLPPKHGAPVRVLMLNRYGMKQPKWLTNIVVAKGDFTGYWEHQGWSKEAIVKTGSAFRAEVMDGGVLAIGGWAFAGRRGISRVEISADGGKTWIPAALKAPLGVNCWQFWSVEWKPPAPGDYTLMARAADGTGAVQPAQPRPTLPDGGQGYHTIKVHA